MWRTLKAFIQTYKSEESTYIAGLVVQLQSAWMHQTCCLFVHRPCQISPVLHSYSPLNWVKDSEISLYWEYRSGDTADIVRGHSKGALSDNFWKVLRWKDSHGMTNFSSIKKKLWAFIPTKPKQCGNSWHFEKIYTCWALGLCISGRGFGERQPGFTLNHLPLGYPSLKKSLLWLLGVSLSHSCESRLAAAPRWSSITLQVFWETRNWLKYCEML